MSSEESNGKPTFEAADGYPRYHPLQRADDSQSATARKRARAAAFNIGIQLVIGIAATVYAVLWLVGSHPLGVIGPGIFGLSSLSSAYLSWRFGAGMDDRQAFVEIFWGVVAAGGIVAMWAIANDTDDHHYREMAVYFSFWLGLMALFALLIIGSFLSPTWRARILARRAERQAAGHEEHA